MPTIKPLIEFSIACSSCNGYLRSKYYGIRGGLSCFVVDPCECHKCKQDAPDNDSLKTKGKMMAECNYDGCSRNADICEECFERDIALAKKNNVCAETGHQEAIEAAKRIAVEEFLEHSEVIRILNAQVPGELHVHNLKKLNKIKRSMLDEMKKLPGGEGG